MKPQWGTFPAEYVPPVAKWSEEAARRFRGSKLPAERGLQRSAVLLLALWLILTLVAWVVPFGAAANSRWIVLLFRVQAALATVACGVTAWGVMRFAAWSRGPLYVLAAMMLPMFPPGTFLAVRIFQLLVTGSEPHLLTKDYEQIVRLAGPMKLPAGRRISAFTWIVMALIVLIIVLASLISLIPEEIRHNL